MGLYVGYTADCGKRYVSAFLAATAAQNCMPRSLVSFQTKVGHLETGSAHERRVGVKLGREEQEGSFLWIPYLRPRPQTATSAREGASVKGLQGASKSAYTGPSMTNHVIRRSKTIPLALHVAARLWTDKFICQMLSGSRKWSKANSRGALGLLKQCFSRPR